MATVKNVSKVLLACGFCALLPLAVACTVDDGTDQNTPQYPYPTVTDFCEAAASGICNAAVVSACDTDASSCVSKVKTECASTPIDLPNVQLSSSLTYHPEAGQDCLNALVAAWADAAIDQGDEATVKSTCIKAFNKNLGVNGTCSDDSDCNVSDGLSCVVHSGKGTCQVASSANGGDDCSDPTVQCSAGYYCDEQSQHCFSDAKEGKACSDVIACAAGLECVQGSTGEALCQTKASDGDACKTNNDCSSGYCLRPSGQTSGGKCHSTDALDSFSSNCDPF